MAQACPVAKACPGSKENQVFLGSKVRMEDLDKMVEKGCQVQMEAKGSVVYLDRWQNKDDEALMDFQDYQVKMVNQDLMALLDVMVKTIPDQVDLVMMEGPELQDYLESLEILVWLVWMVDLE